MDNYQSPTMEYAAGDFQSENQRITTVIPVVAYRRSPHKKGMYTKNKYIYDYDKDIYICPNNVALIYKQRPVKAIRNTDALKKYVCICPHKDKCVGEKAKYKIIRTCLGKS